MGEFAISPLESVGSVFGTVRNPYNLDVTLAGEAAARHAAMPIASAVLRSYGPSCIQHILAYTGGGFVAALLLVATTRDLGICTW